MLRSDEVKMLKNALNNSKNHRPLEDLGVGEAFIKLAQAEKCPQEELLDIRRKSGAYLFTMLQLLLDKFPSNLDAVSKLKFLVPQLALARTARPQFKQLPTELAGNDYDLDELERQWVELATFTLPDICPAYEGTIENLDIVEFWSSVLNLKNAGGEAPFKQISRFALMCLTLPISNALVERAFSVMRCIKCWRRNKMQLLMIEALMRLRIHLKVAGICCKNFEPTKAMLSRFTADVYQKHRNHHDLAPAQRDPNAHGVLNEEAVDDPAAVMEEIVTDLEDIDYQIIDQLDEVNFKKSLLLEM